MGIYILSLILSVSVAGLVLLMVTRSYPSFKMEETHWLLVIVCVVITLFSMTTAIQSKRCIKAIDSGSASLVSYGGLLGRILDFDFEDESIARMADDAIESFRQTQRQKFYKPLYISITLAVVVNVLLFLVLRKAGKTSTRRKSGRTYSGGSNYSSSIDNF